MSTDDNAAFTISESAMARLQYIFSKQSAQKKLRIYISGGGCSGFQYVFELVDMDNCEDGDVEYKDMDGNVVLSIDSISIAKLHGSCLDYQEHVIGSQFLIKNPNAKSSCGCGNSFNV